MSEADGMDSGQVAIQGHHSQDVCADNLAVGIKRCDYSAHGATEAPGAIAHKLVDEKRHAEEKEEVRDGQTEDEYVWYCLLGAQLGFLQNGVDYSAVSKGPEETDETKDAGHEHIVVLLMFWQKKKDTNRIHTISHLEQTILLSVILFPKYSLF